MSAQVEERIVGLRFDNKDFEKNVDHSMKTLDKLNASLGNTFQRGANAITIFASKLKAISIDPVAKTAELSMGKIMALTAALTGVSNVADEAYRKVTTLIRSMGADQASAGWDKYANYTQSIQTIMSATRQEGETEEEALKRVNVEMEKLLWFADETSYSLTDMTDNIGKFTAQGIDLETSVKAMQGIALWAAAAGQGSSAASRAMYNLSQSLGKGSVKLTDWMSIENANMATKEFKELALEAGVVAGTLEKVGKEYKIISTGEMVSTETFRDSLKDDWFTTEALLEVTDQYSEFAQIVYDEVKRTGKLTSQVIEDLKDTAQDMYPIGFKAMEMAQSAITFAQAIDSVKDAVSTQFMRIYQAIFGDYLKAKDLWTDFANELWEIFAGPLNQLANALTRFSEVGSMSKIVNDFWRAWNDVLDIINAVKDSFYEMLGLVYDEKSESYEGSFIEKTVFYLNQMQQKLHEARVEFSNFTRRLMQNDTLWANLTNFFEGLKSAFNIIKNFIDTIYDRLVTKLIGQTSSFIDLIGMALSKFGSLLQDAEKFVKDTDFFNTMIDNIIKAAESAKIIFDKIVKSIKQIKITMQVTLETLARTFNTSGKYSTVGMPSALQRLEDGVNGMSDDIENFTDLAITSIEAITVAVRGAVPFFAQLWIWIKDIFRNVKAAGEKIKEWITKFGDFVSKKFGGMFNSLKTNIKDWYKDFSLSDIINQSESWLNFLQKIKNVVSFIYGFIFGVPEDMSKFKKPVAKDSMSAITGIVGFILNIMEAIDPLIDKLNEWSGGENLFDTLERAATILAKLVPLFWFMAINIQTLTALIAYIIYVFTTREKQMHEGLIYATGNFFTDLKNVPSAIIGAMEKLTEIVDPIKKHMKNIRQIINKLFIIGMVIAIIQAIAVACMGLIALSFVPWGKLLFITLVALPMMVALVVASVGVLNAMVEKMEDLTTGKSNTKKVHMLGEYILMVAISFLAVASAVAILASISAEADLETVGNGKPTSPFSRAMTAMTAILGIFITFITAEMILASKFNEGVGKVGGVGELVLKMGISILLIAFAIAKISKVPADDLARSQIVIYALMGIFGVIVFLVEYSGMSEEVARSIYALGAMCLMMSGSLLMACGAMILIAKKMSEEELIKSGIVIGTMYILLSAFLAGATVLANWMANKKDTFKNFVALGGMIFTLALSLMIFTAAMKELVGSTDWKQLGEVVADILILLAGIGVIVTAATVLVNKFGNFDVLVAVGSIITGILSALAIIIASLTAMDLNEKKVGLLFLVSVIFAGLVAAIGFLIVAMAKVATNQYGAIALVIGTVIAMILSGIGMIILGIGLIALGIGLVANAMAELAKLEDQDESKMKKLGRTVGAAFESFFVSIRDALGIFVGMIFDQIGKIFDRLGDSGLLAKFKKFFTQLAHTIGAYVKDNHEIIKETLITVIEDLLDVFTTVVNDKGPAVLEALSNFLKELFRHIKDIADNEGGAALGALIDVVINALDTIFNKLFEYSARINTLFLTTGLSLVGSWNIIKLALVNGIFATITYVLIRLRLSAVEFGNAAALIAINFFLGVLMGIQEGLPMLLDEIMLTIIFVIESIADTIDEHTDDLIKAADRLLDSLINAMNKWVNSASQAGGKLYNAGWNVIRGIARGLLAGMPVLNSIVTGIANSGIVKTFCDRMGIKSPSTVMKQKGGFAIKGLEIGMKDEAKNIPDIVGDIANMVGGAFTNTFGDPTEILAGFGSNLLGYFKDTVLGGMDLSSLKEGLMGGLDINSLMSGMGMDINSLMGEFSDFNPVITPTLDTSVIESQFGGIQSMFGEEQVQSINGIFSSPMAGMDSVSMQSNFDALMGKMQDYMNVQSYNSGTKVNVTLEGDAKKMLKLLKVENLKQTKATGVNQLVTK